MFDFSGIPGYLDPLSCCWEEQWSLLDPFGAKSYRCNYSKLCVMNSTAACRNVWWHFSHCVAWGTGFPRHLSFRDWKKLALKSLKIVPTLNPARRCISKCTRVLHEKTFLSGSIPKPPKVPTQKQFRARNMIYEIYMIGQSRSPFL